MLKPPTSPTKLSAERSIQRYDLYVDGPGVTILNQCDVFSSDCFLFLFGVGDGISQLHHQSILRHFEKIPGRLASRKIEIRRQVSPELNDMHCFVDDDTWSSEARRKQYPIDSLG